MKFNELNKTDWEDAAKYLANEMDDMERKVFEQRINFSQENKEYFEKVKTDWENMNDLKEQNAFNAEKAWGKLYNKFEEDGLLVQKSRKVGIGNLVKIAAIFIIGILLTTLAYYTISDNKNSGWQVASTYENTNIQQIELSDGSVVYLNANSKLYYPETFDGNTRTIEFEGDGFFDIARDESKPFIIKAKKAEVKVLGTSFNINTKKGEDKVEVLVETGKVQLSNLRSGKAQILERGDIGKLINREVVKEKNKDKNYLSWKTRDLYFEDVPFNEIIEVISRVYNVDIDYNESIINNSPINSPLYNKSLDTVLQIICETKQISYIKKEDGSIVLIQK